MKKNILTHILTTIKYILTHILILLLLFAAAGDAIHFEGCIIYISFFTIPSIVGLTIFLIKKCKKEQITPRALINQTFKTSAITLGTLALLNIILKYKETYIPFFLVAILFLLSIFTKITDLPTQKTSKFKTFLSVINAIYFQCMILFIYSTFIGYTSSHFMGEYATGEDIIHLLNTNP